jgi:50S ribosomal protein L16 3-hydroxylase
MRAIRWSHKDVQACLGCFLTTPKPHVVFRRPRRKRSLARFVADLPRGTVCLDPRTRLLYCAERFFLNGEEIIPGKTQRAALAQLADRRRLAGSALARRGLGDLLYGWYEDGYLDLERPS